MIDVDVLLRAVAITAVVWNHTRPLGFEPIPGAMATLLRRSARTWRASGVTRSSPAKDSTS